MEYHRGVMIAESMAGLEIQPGGTYVDVTFGGGGHSRAILEGLGAEGRVVAFDQDADALRNAIDDERFCLLHENFRYMKNFLRMRGIGAVDGIMADLGVSSHQFDEGERGFSTRMDGALDLRMDQRQEERGSDVVNRASEEELSRLLHLYGELPNARAMARAIVAARREKEIATTQELRRAVERHLPRGRENKYLAMLFQAIRIEVNGELEALEALLRQAAEVLKPGGRLVVIAYHSLEDRLVKNYMRSGKADGEIEKDFYGNILTPWKIVTRKAVTPSEEELRENNRSRSAKLRVAERR